MFFKDLDTYQYDIRLGFVSEMAKNVLINDMLWERDEGMLHS